jgi:hypothetical protein
MSTTTTTKQSADDAGDNGKPPLPYTIPFHLLPSTPTKRKKRASFSPRKRTVTKTRTSDPFPVASPSQSKKPYNIVPYNTSDHDTFHPFSLWDDEKRSFRRPSQCEQEAKFQKLLDQFYNLSGLTIIFPWCILEFEGELPASNERPFLIASLVAVYIDENDEFPLGTSYLGMQGGGDDPDDPPHIVGDLYPYHTPSLATFEYLHERVECAEHVSSYPKQLLFELPIMTNEQFNDILPSLPRQFGSQLAFYYNGEFVHTVHTRRNIPNSQFGSDGTKWRSMIRITSRKRMEGRLIQASCWNLEIKTMREETWG